ncbi:hypothetical protein PAA8504_01409 [Palleronia abyssalis]|uniref:STAS domain-containing protein n=1 Tax=Palleronia abyssalis TaxID=1501240 RepID=A0A2R8BU31_9RHOB|nr:hypothetical protein PAA8504_01409 [Palleronia abyssalis]
MPAASPRDEIAFNFPPDLDAGNISEIYLELLSISQKVEGTDSVVTLDFADSGEKVSPLSMQLLVSAQRTFADGNLKLGQNAEAVMSEIGRSREI